MKFGCANMSSLFTFKIIFQGHFKTGHSSFSPPPGCIIILDGQLSRSSGLAGGVWPSLPIPSSVTAGMFSLMSTGFLKSGTSASAVLSGGWEPSRAASQPPLCGPAPEDWEGAPRSRSDPPQSEQNLSSSLLVDFKAPPARTTPLHTPLFSLNPKHLQSFQWIPAPKTHEGLLTQATSICSSANISKARNYEGKTYGSRTAGKATCARLWGAAWPAGAMLTVLSLGTEVAVSLEHEGAHSLCPRLFRATGAELSNCDRELKTYNISYLVCWPPLWMSNSTSRSRGFPPPDASLPQTGPGRRTPDGTVCNPKAWKQHKCLSIGVVGYTVVTHAPGSTKEEQWVNQGGTYPRIHTSRKHNAERKRRYVFHRIHLFTFQ